MPKLINFLKARSVRTRLAPSPTGPLHVGTSRTALFNHIFAKQNKGKFILRIEDTDAERSDKRFEDDIVKGLKWLGLEYDEFYRQSERKKIYEKYLKKLLEKKMAFRCYHSKEKLTEEKRIQMQNKQAPRHICEHKNIESSNPENKNGIIRLKGATGKISFNDLIRGRIEYDANLMGDIAIAKSEQEPLYNLAVVIDDYEMKISHIIRGEDHIPNTPKQILIQKALGIETPLYAHLPLILGPDRTKLSKRHGATSINEYKRLGYLPQAFTNFMALLGWNPRNDQELFSIQELIKSFSLKKTQKGGAVFNIDKLNWFNQEYIKKISVEELSKEAMEYIPPDWHEKIKKDKEYWRKILELEKPRLTILSELKEGSEFFFNKPVFSKSLLSWKDNEPDDIAQHIDKVIKLLSNIESGSFAPEEIKKAVWDYAEEKGRGNVLWPFRVAITGRTKSPDPFSVAEILGKKETLERLENAKKMLL